MAQCRCPSAFPGLLPALLSPLSHWALLLVSLELFPCPCSVQSPVPGSSQLCRVSGSAGAAECSSAAPGWVALVAQCSAGMNALFEQDGLSQLSSRQLQPNPRRAESWV